MDSRRVANPKGVGGENPGGAFNPAWPEVPALSNRLLTRLFDELRLPIVLLDNNCTPFYANRSALDLFAANIVEPSFSALLEGLSANDRAKLEQTRVEVLAGQPGMVLFENGRDRAFTLTGLYNDGSLVPAALVLCASRERLCEPGTLAGFARQHRLTRSERDILDLVVSGRSAHEIAAHRGVSEATVRTHLKNTLHKTGHRTLRQLQATLGRLPPV